MDYLKNVANKAVQSITLATGLVAPPNEDVFFKDGRLTPKQFELCGDKLISCSGEWSFKSFDDIKLRNTYLNDNKQYLFRGGIESRQRVKDMLEETSGKIIFEVGEDNFIGEAQTSD